MTVAVIGTGFIGGTLGRAFARAGIPTVFGSRRPDDVEVAADSGATIWSGQFDSEVADLPTAQDDTVNRIAGALGARLVDTEARRVEREHKRIGVATIVPDAACCLEPICSTVPTPTSSPR